MPAKTARSPIPATLSEKLTLSRTTGYRGGPSNVHPPRTVQGVALLDVGLLPCRVEGPSTSDRERLGPKPHRAAAHPQLRAGGPRRGCCLPIVRVFGQQ